MYANQGVKVGQLVWVGSGQVKNWGDGKSLDVNTVPCTCFGWVGSGHLLRWGQITLCQLCMIDLFWLGQVRSYVEVRSNHFMSTLYAVLLVGWVRSGQVIYSTVVCKSCFETRCITVKVTKKLSNIKSFIEDNNIWEQNVNKNEICWNEGKRQSQIDVNDFVTVNMVNVW